MIGSALLPASKEQSSLSEGFPLLPFSLGFCESVKDHVKGRELIHYW